MSNQQNPSPKTPTILSADDEISSFSKVNHLKVTKNQEGQRIDNFLMTRLKGLPKSHIYQLIRKGEIRVNKSRIKPHSKLFTDDIVRIAPIRLSTKDKPIVGADFANKLLAAIIFEDDNIIVLNKPSGIAVHGGSGQSYGVIEALRQATNKEYLELIHRIDKETSGILLIAKKRSALKKIQAFFREKTIKKQYQALVFGHPNDKHKQIDKPLKRILLNNGERRVLVDSEGKESLTDIQVLEKLTGASLILAKPHTGRTHQIRVHCLSEGHPLLGDEKYHKNDLSNAPRLCLHAWKISIPEYGSFEAPLPNDILKFIEELRTNS